MFDTWVDHLERAQADLQQRAARDAWEARYCLHCLRTKRDTWLRSEAQRETVLWHARLFQLSSERLYSCAEAVGSLRTLYLYGAREHTTRLHA